MLPACLLACVLCTSLAGCWSSQWARTRRVPRNPLDQPLELLSRSGPHPTQRTMQLLRRYDMAGQWGGRPDQLLAQVQQIADIEPTADNVYAVAELAYIAGRKIEAEGDEPLALDMFGTAVANAYLYLLNDEFDAQRNPYDPQFRGACDLYNAALESTLRMIQRQGLLKPGEQHTIATARQEFDLTIQLRGPWREENIAELKFVSDYEVQGLKNHYHTYGLGVPLIAVYQNAGTALPGEAYYPPGMSFPVTAFLRVLPAEPTRTTDGRPHHACVLELHDSLAASDIDIHGRLVPLETDLTTPLAFCLDNPIFKDAHLPTRGLIKPEKSREGLYMLEVFDPDKIPVLMVHGFWSSLVTWMEMFNDLRGSREVARPLPVLVLPLPHGPTVLDTAPRKCARNCGGPCAAAGSARPISPLDRMVLVGHSMGGLICKLQTLDSGDRFWRLVSDQPFSQLESSPEDREKLANLLFFHPNQSVSRVVMIATPHRGSHIANGATQWLGSRIIHLPQQLVKTKEALASSHPELFHPTSLLNINTVVDSLAPDSPILPVMLNAPRGPWIEYHNIVGLLDERPVIGKVVGPGDGVVTYESAHLEEADSEVVVSADHVTIHRSPRTILEVHRILREHLQDVHREQTAPYDAQRQQPAPYDAQRDQPAGLADAIGPPPLPSAL